MNYPRAAAVLVLLSVTALIAGCGGDDDTASETPMPATESASETYAEGDVRLEIEYLDTGLLKGHAYGDAAEGWVIEAIRVEAVDDQDIGWPVIEPERTGLGSRNATEFFEVTIQELPRGEQVSVTTTVTFTDSAGGSIDRTATDAWPP